MILPYANEIEQDVEFVQSFTGYNHNLRCGQGQFYDMENMTGDYAPVLSTRSLRSQVLVLQGECDALFSKDYIYYACQGNLVWGEIEGTTWNEVGRLNGVLTTGEKMVADIGGKVLILPDKKVFDIETHTISNATYYFEDNTWTRVVEGVSYTTEGKLRFTPSTLEGEPLTYTASATEPEDKTVYWLNTTNNTVLRYNEALSMWQQLDNVYLKVEPVLTYGAAGAGSDATEWLNNFKTIINSLKDYDTVNIKVKSYDSSYGELGGDTVIFHRGDGFFTIVGIQPTQFDTGFEFKNRFPEMSYICSLNNRIWGCDTAGHEVYACKLGDPTQWYNYAGLSGDSFAATVGSDGLWTGAAAYNNNVLFFKKDKLHKVMGNFPSNFQVGEYTVNGVATGCHKTLAVVNGYLFYLGEERVMVYDGSLPRSCSEDFGDMRFTSGVGGQQMNKYYLCTHGKDGQIRVFVYDTEKGQWWKEDDTEIETCTTHFNQLIGCHYLKDDQEVWRHVLVAEVGSYEGLMDWFVETGDLGLDTPYQKYISKVVIRMSFEGSMYAEIAYDGGQFNRIINKTSADLRSYNININVKRCDHFRLKIGGEGVCKIYSFAYNVETGTEIV